MTLTKEEQDVYHDEKGIFETLNKKFKPQFNETIKLLQFHKLVHLSNESVEEWMGRLRTATVECKYKEVDRQLKEQFIHGWNDDEILVEIIRELAKCEENIIPSETVLAWGKRKQTQRAQTAVISSLYEMKNFDAIIHKDNRLRYTKHASNTIIMRKRCKYCRQEYKPG